MAIGPGLEAAALALLLAASAFFSTSETAFIGVNRIQVRRRAAAGDRTAALVDSMLDDPERILSTVLVGNTLVNISAAGLAAHLALSLGLPLATTVATVAMTLVVLILCELVPKTLAVQNPWTIVRLVARPLRLVETVLKPVIVTSSAVARGIVRPFGLKARGKAPFITTDEIEMLVGMGVQEGGVQRFEQRVISEVFEFTETPVHRIMTPRDQVHHVDRQAKLADAAHMASTEGRSRILVVGRDFDDVLGCVHSRDMLRLTDEELARLPVTHLLRRVLYVSHDSPADKLLGRMQAAHCLLAVVQDDEGANLGIVTAEDLLEELVGEIHDEFDTPHGPSHAGSQNPSPAQPRPAAPPGQAGASGQAAPAGNDPAGQAMGPSGPPR